MAEPVDQQWNSPALTAVNNTYFAGSATGTTSATDYIYAKTILTGSYKIINVATTTVSSVDSCTFPDWGNTYIKLNVQGTVSVNVINTVSGLAASAIAGHWNFTTSNVSGGLSTSGNLYTLSAGEKYMPVTQTAVTGVYALPNGQTFNALGQSYFQEWEEHNIMAQLGPWPRGLASNTSATLPGAMNSVWASLGTSLKNAGAGQLESFSFNWAPGPN
tara:strand:- start:2264 stop:2914 length:651 start_codon:yes stop_codon:yes gene_type:complete